LSFDDDEYTQLNARETALMHLPFSDTEWMQCSFFYQQHVLSLCRILLSLERTRDDAIVICIHLLHDQRFRDTAGFTCLPELRAAIIQRMLSADTEQSSCTTAAFLQRVHDAIVGFLRAPDLAKKLPVEFGGHIQALELLPTALDCAQSVLHVAGGRGAWQELQDVRASTLESVLGAAWPAAVVLPLFTALCQVDLCPKERDMVYAKVETSVSGPPASIPTAARPGARLDLRPHLVALVQVRVRVLGEQGGIFVGW
jgi:hypothetical protein